MEEVQKEHFSARIDKVFDYYSAPSVNSRRRGGSCVPVNTRIKMNNHILLFYYPASDAHVVSVLALRSEPFVMSASKAVRQQIKPPCFIC